MATPSNKPRDIKDLKARLGRTVTPGQAGVPMPGASVPPPARPGASVPPPSVGGLPAPQVRNPLTGAPLGAPRPSVPAPPFAQPGARPGAQSARPPAAAAGAPAARGPFDIAGAGAIVEKKVRLVIDDSAVKESEIGRKSGFRNIVLIVIGLALGLTVGFGVGSTAADRKQFSMAVRDGKDIYSRIGEVSKQLEPARAALRTAVESSQGGPGKQAHVNYKAIEDLLAQKRPFTAAEFSRRRYLAFPTPVVDDLFDYYNNITLLWDKFELLGNKVAGDRAREALDKSAKAAEELIATDFGVVISKAGDVFVGGLVVARAKPPEPGVERKEDDPQIVMVSSRDGGREVERTLYTGQEDFAEKYEQYVITVDKGRSMGTLGAPANLFGQFRGEVMATQGIMDKTLEIQGRLLKELGKVAALEE